MKWIHERAATRHPAVNTAQHHPQSKPWWLIIPRSSIVANKQIHSVADSITQYPMAQLPMFPILLDHPGYVISIPIGFHKKAPPCKRSCASSCSLHANQLNRALCWSKSCGGRGIHFAISHCVHIISRPWLHAGKPLQQGAAISPRASEPLPLQKYVRRHLHQGCARVKARSLQAPAYRGHMSST